MNYAFVGLVEEGRLQWFSSGLAEALNRAGHTLVAESSQAQLLVNLMDSGSPRPYRGTADPAFVVSVTGMEPPFGGPLVRGYPLLIRSLSNLLIGLVNDEDPLPTAHFVTPEQGHYTVSGTLAPSEYFRAVVQKIHPLASSRRVLNNVFEPDLPSELWKGDPNTEALYRAGKRLGELNLLPPPFPMDEVLDEDDQRHLKLRFGIGGLSYGNLSARLDGTRFWMSASGVDKTDLREVGRDFLLVKDYDPGRNAIILSVPPDVEPRRASVDTIEHWMIYREHPEVGAILHVHAWMDGIRATEVNYPCGTYELAAAVADIVREAPVSREAVVGLKNHGLTMVGRSMDEIFQRVEGKIFQPVPMS
ncbi:class II aldolase/adducin family protein [Gemmatimonadota bacterium]